jgi:hypothetical protein
LFAARTQLIGGGALAGLVLAAAVWLVFRLSGAVIAPIGDLQVRLAANRPPAAPVVVPNGAAARAVAAPLFALTTGPGAVSDVAVRLDGLAISPHGQSALVSINNQPAQWLALGATRDGVTLTEVHPSKVVLDTAIGFKEVAVGQQAAPAAAPAPPSSKAIPPGARLLPPPASAPGSR